MSDTPFRGILHGVTELPGYERPAVDGELCEWKSAGDQGVWGEPPAHFFYCDFCERWLPPNGEWKHGYVCSWCPDCKPDREAK